MILFNAICCLALIGYAVVKGRPVFGLENIILFGGLFRVAFASEIMAVTPRQWVKLVAIGVAIVLGWLMMRVTLDGGLLELLVSSVVICSIGAVTWLVLER
jgi:hypothetical protein